jgi:hypothetical protein
MADEGGTALEKGSAWLATGFVILTAALGALGASGGGVDRMFRNFTLPARLAFTAIGISIVCAGLSMIFGGVALRQVLLAIGVVFFAAGLIVAIALASIVPTTKEQPTVTAKLTRSAEGLSLEATVKAAGLRSDEVFRVVVDGISGADLERLYTAEMGPDPAGKIDVILQIPLPPAGRFAQLGIAGGLGDQRDKCFEEEVDVPNESGCVVLSFPQEEPSPATTPTGG